MPYLDLHPSVCNFAVAHERTNLINRRRRPNSGRTAESRAVAEKRKQMGIFGPLECRSRRDKFQYGCPTHFQLAKNKPVTKRASKQLAGVLAEIHECENIAVPRGLEFKWGYCLADWILGPMHAEKSNLLKRGVSRLA